MKFSGFSKSAIVGLLAGAFALSANAASCDLGSLRVTELSVAGVSGSGTSADIDYRSCYGAFSGNDQPYPSTGTYLGRSDWANIGLLDDGLLNGALQKKTEVDLFGNGAFLDDPYAPHDLNGDGILDPGWIYLGKIEFDGTNGFIPVASIGGVEGIVLPSFFTASYDSQTGSGSWAFTPDAQVASRASVILGDNYFDQFALVFKQETEFAAYNFTGQQFGVDHPSAYGPILNFSGDFNMSGVFGSTDISHISLWARDPGADGNVPEPGSLALVGLGIMGVAALRRRKQSK